MERNGIEWNGMEQSGVEWSRVERKRKNQIKSVCSVESKGKFCSMNDKFLCMLGYNVKYVSLCESLTEFEIHCLNTQVLLLSHFSRVQLCATPQKQPTRLRRPRDSPGKNTGVGCHFLLQRMKVKSESEVTQSYPTLGDPMDRSPPGSSVHGIFRARVLEWGAIAFSVKYIAELVRKSGKSLEDQTEQDP